MRVDAGEALRRAWEKKDKCACTHAVAEQEHDEREDTTGRYLCTTCGAYVDPPKEDMPGPLGNEEGEQNPHHRRVKE